MSEQTLPQTKVELLARIAQGRAALEQALSQLSEAQLTTRKDQNGWSIKDHLAHMAAWEIGIAALLQRRPRWAAMGLDEAAVSNHETDDLNDIIYRQHKGRPLAEVKAYFEEAHRQLLAALNHLSETELFKPYAYYDESETDDDNRPIISWVVGNTYQHYAEHQAWIEAQR
jgi:hypothetical protein